MQCCTPSQQTWYVLLLLSLLPSSTYSISVCRSLSPTCTSVNPLSQPTVHGTDEEELSGTSERRSRFPPIPTSHSLTAAQNIVTPISVGITRGFPKSMQAKQPQSPKNSLNEKFSGSIQKSRVSQLPPVTSVPAAPSPPFGNADHIDPLTQTGQTISESETPKLPPLPHHTTSQAQTVNGGAVKPPSHQGDGPFCGLATPAARVPAQSYVTRQSTFKEAPLGYKLTHTRNQGAGAGKVRF